MPRTAARCTQADLARALRAVEQVGAPGWAVELHPDGRIRIEKGAAERQRPTVVHQSDQQSDLPLEKDDGFVF